MIRHDRQKHAINVDQWINLLYVWELEFHELKVIEWAIELVVLQEMSSKIRYS